ncbi:hypothetical protein BO70DRAFT_288405 [Aspergillus heteromorphus CBS 117.55]|uniref:Rhodopsin domain-containing protein n=1 Tax=Aspergillus heteromorphus CBS 117.55 TaxID=1448321 RepID=A0A317WK61_9EURO|nr:uncharacterized protein BO70DRAFT_288405 [Aspergillus heteromorphus CBS 117.55]PWY86753.1 hypothetical protein BO70DRAFT_288405 [Aspergillus heteromorphus CBS 117.55]
MAGSQAPFEILSEDNRGPLVTLVSAAFLITAIIFVAAKIASVVYFKHRRTSVSIPIWVALVVVMQKAVDNGLGRHLNALTDTAIRISSEYTYTAQLIEVVVLSLSKISTALLVWKLTPHHGIRRACTITISLTAAWAVFALFGVAFQCEIPEPWIYSPSRCTGQGAILYPIIVTHILIEILIIAIPFFMLHEVQLKWTAKVKILCSFSARGLVVIMGACQLALLPSVLHSTDPSSMVCTSVITACMPTLYHIFAGLHSGLITTQLPEELELKHANGSAYRSQLTNSGRRGGARYLYATGSGIFGSGTNGTKGEVVRKTSVSESTESTRQLTRELNRDGVLKTVDITVQVEDMYSSGR